MSRSPFVVEVTTETEADMTGVMTLGSWLGLAAAILFLFVLPTIAVIALFVAVFGDEAENVADVRRYMELRDEARRLMSPGLPLLDDDEMAAATAEIGLFQAKRDEARKAIWRPRAERRDVEPVSRVSRAQRPRAA
jgi:hypothetical protein